MGNRNRYLAGKVAWVTGSSRGIGRVVAAHLASLGAAVAVHGTTPLSTRAFNEADSLEAVSKAIAKEHGTNVLPVHGDLADEKVVKNLTGEIRSKLGQIDILVNCAGGDIGAQGAGAPMGGKPPKNDAVFISPEDIRSVLDRNLMTCILVCREVAPEMMERRTGRIVNFGSISGLQGIKESVIYATAKAAVHEYTRCLAVMLRPYNVTVNAVAPGEIVTPRFLASRQTDPNRFVEEGTLDRYGKPIEIARTIQFLISEGGSYITGQVIRVDGGMQCWPA
ncbi:MAG TPA: SDR family oxidoreductase [Thermodesulfobacteriota bacterium]|nr:SDR family oxidoreductase [Thermodesulfobacteriota bacterium]